MRFNKRLAILTFYFKYVLPNASNNQMLRRIEGALQTLVTTASQTETGVIAAVAHSAYLRMLLATVSDISLLSAYKLQQGNCCVNVLDFERRGSLVAASKKKEPSAFSLPAGGPVSSLPLDLRIPAGRVERINETRHLQSILS